MDFEFSADQEMLRDSVRRYLAERAPIAWVREQYGDVAGALHQRGDDVWKGLAALGVTGILVPEAHGGLGLGMVDIGVVLEEMGRAVYPGPFLSSAVGAVSLADAELLGALATGDTVATLAVYEPDRRWDWRHPQTRLDGASVTGRKGAVADAEAADVLLVTACQDAGLVVVAVDARAGGVTVTSDDAVDGTRPSATVDLTDAPARVVVAADATPAVATGLDRLAVGMVVDGVGAAAVALDMAVAYAKERVQFDRPIGSFQAVQHLCADMLRDLELARAGAYYALWACDQGDAALRHEAATMAKAWASDALARVGAGCIQVHGGIGFTWEHDAHLYYKRLLTLQHAHGGTSHHLDELAHLVLD